MSTSSSSFPLPTNRRGHLVLHVPTGAPPKLPSICCCCAGTPDTQLETRAYVSPQSYFVTRLPVCAACKQRASGTVLLQTLVIFAWLALVVGLAVALRPARGPMPAGSLVLVLLAIIGTVIPHAMVPKLRSRAGHAPGCASAKRDPFPDYEALRVAGVASVAIGNEAFAAEWARLNPGRKR